MTPSSPLVSIVVIGRNEGERLIRCLESIHAINLDGFHIETIYVDSASGDGSPARAAALGARVIEVQPQRPSAAIGRNAGWRAAQGEFIMFLDGDTVLHPGFIARALEEMRAPEVAVVWGHRRESRPEQSIYVRVLDLDWVYKPGVSEFCGGDALMRRRVLEESGGFDDTLIAGEEPELCRRLRAQGHTILHIDAPMTLHDLAIGTFAAYWKRAFRAGYAYAELAARFGSSNDPLWQRESRRNLIQGALLMLSPAMLLLSAWQPWIAVMLALLAIALITRTLRRCAWKSRFIGTRTLYALHSIIQQVPIMFGQLGWYADERRGRLRFLIDYKQP